jgi:hypothetical protein
MCRAFAAQHLPCMDYAQALIVADSAATYFNGQRGQCHFRLTIILDSHCSHSLATRHLPPNSSETAQQASPDDTGRRQPGTMSQKKVGAQR